MMLSEGHAVEASPLGCLGELPEAPSQKDELFVAGNAMAPEDEHEMLDEGVTQLRPVLGPERLAGIPPLDPRTKGGL